MPKLHKIGRYIKEHCSLKFSEYNIYVLKILSSVECFPLILIEWYFFATQSFIIVNTAPMHFRMSEVR